MISSTTPIGGTSLSLTVNGVAYTRFQRVRVSTGIEQLAGDFELDCADGWAIQGQPMPVLPGLACSVQIGGVPVITGWIDDAQPAYDARHHQLTIRGRDATGDLVDCAAQVDGQGWEGRTLTQVAEDLCKPFGIPVTVVDNVGPAYAGSIFAKPPRSLSSMPSFRSTRINPGETVFEVLSRAAALRGALLVADNLGGLTITRAGSNTTQTALKRGVNILGGRALHSQRDRFHTYNVFGQGNAFYVQTQRSAAQKVLASVTDPAIRTPRVTAIITSDDSDAGLAQQVAAWARANHAAKGERAQIRVRGWLDGTTPWQPNTLISIADDYLAINGQWLIAQVDFELDEHDGEIATLTVTPPAAYVPMPQQEYDPAAGMGYSG